LFVGWKTEFSLDKGKGELLGKKGYVVVVVVKAKESAYMNIL